MEQREEMDLHRCDAVWQRVAPGLNPYPEVRAAVERVSSPAAAAPVTTSQGIGDVFTPEALAVAIEEELAARRAYLTRARCVGGTAARTLTQMAADGARHAGRMGSLYFLLTGECYRAVAAGGEEAVLGLCQFLRLRYSAAMRAAARLEGWADGMDDACMASAVQAMAVEKRCQAAALMDLLESRLR